MEDGGREGGGEGRRREGGRVEEGRKGGREGERASDNIHCLNTSAYIEYSN